MKRKLIDIPDSTFKALSVKAALRGTNLKAYIEGLLDEDAATLEESGFEYGGRSLRDEPSDAFLMSVMKEASSVAARRAIKADERYFANIESQIKALKNGD